MVRCSVLFLSVFGAAVCAQGAVYYVSANSGDDANLGDRQRPFRTIAQALKLVDGPGGEIHLGGETYREVVRIQKGGTAGSPLIIEGNGAVVNLGTDISAGPWTLVGDAYRYGLPVPPTTRRHVTSPVFVNGLPLCESHPQGRGHQPWHEGEVRFDEHGQLLVKFPRGLSPQNAVVVLTGPHDQNPAIGLVGSTSHVTIRNLTAAFAGNDGFNFHGSGDNVLLENVRAVFNGDQGISSHGQCVVTVRDSEVAFNGSQGAGVVDINNAVTTYENTVVHQNRNGGLQLQGKAHILKHVTSYSNPGGNLPKPSESIIMTDCLDLGFGPLGGKEMIPVATQGQLQGRLADVTPAMENRLARFLALRPPTSSKSILP